MQIARIVAAALLALGMASCSPEAEKAAPVGGPGRSSQLQFRAVGRGDAPDPRSALYQRAEQRRQAAAPRFRKAGELFEQNKRAEAYKEYQFCEREYAAALEDVTKWAAGADASHSKEAEELTRDVRIRLRMARERMLVLEVSGDTGAPKPAPPAPTVAEAAADVEREIKAWFAGGRDPKTYATWCGRGGAALRPLLPALLKSDDKNVLHEALLIARDMTNAPEVAPEVIAVLEKLLAKPVDEEAGTRRLACKVLGKLGDAKAIPVLLKALGDPYYRQDLFAVPGVGGAHVEWRAVWRDADEALRAITKASPIDQPKMREPDPRETPAALKKAWQAWWEANQGKF